MLLDLEAIRDPNRAGQAYALMFVTPIRPGAEDMLRATLEALRDHDDASPFEQLDRTHFARFVICEDFVTAKGQPHEDRLGCQYLLFTCCVDGEPDSYLEQLTTELGPITERIYRHCIGAPIPSSGPELVAYLRHNQIDSGLFFSAYPEWRVPDVRRVLAHQRTMRRLAVDAHTMSPAELQQAFLTEIPG
ncbi:MAG: hypothetical protein JHC95_05055 [Solirubrobacteraceae bacterium]|nr:hypothetical protein [Solirubrobacteraceae bacterium]